MPKHKLKILLTPTYDKTPCDISIRVGDEIIDATVTDKIEYQFDYPDSEWLQLKIHKSGKTKSMADSGQRQELVVERLTLNGFNCYPELFGNFLTIGNPYVSNSTTQTNRMHLNGVWNYRVPLWNLDAVDCFTLGRDMRDTPRDSSIATFGCSFTYGYGLEIEDTWPVFLSSYTGKSVANYGVGGSNNAEILETALQYTKNNKTQDLIFLLCHFSRMQLRDDNEIISGHVQMDWPENKKFREDLENIVKYGETELLFAGQSKAFLEKISLIKKNISGKIFVTTYVEDHYDCLEKLQSKDFVLLPFYKLDKEKKFAIDGHPGKEHNRQFAESIVKYI